MKEPASCEVVVLPPLDGKAPARLGLVPTTDWERPGRRAGVSSVPRAGFSPSSRLLPGRSRQGTLLRALGVI